MARIECACWNRATSHRPPVDDDAVQLKPARVDNACDGWWRPVRIARMWARAVLMRACCSAVITVGGASLPGWACFLSGPAAAEPPSLFLPCAALAVATERRSG